MPTQKECHICGERIGVASKTCQYCHAKQPYKQKLETRKKQLSHEWKTRQKKNSSVNKVYDASNLLLHKWEVLERYPALLLARRTSNGFTAECLCPWQMDTEEAKDAFDTIKSIYENLLNGDDKKCKWLIPGSVYTSMFIFHCVRLWHYFLLRCPCKREMSDYTLLHDQSSSHDVHDVIEKAELVTDFCKLEDYTDLNRVVYIERIFD